MRDRKFTQNSYLQELPVNCYRCKTNELAVCHSHLLDVDALRLDLSFELPPDDHQLRPLPPVQSKAKSTREGDRDDEREAMRERKHENKTLRRGPRTYVPGYVPAPGTLLGQKISRAEGRSSIENHLLPKQIFFAMSFYTLTIFFL